MKEMKKIKWFLITMAFAGLCACGSEWNSGEYEGNFKLAKGYGESFSETVSNGNGRIRFPSANTLRLSGGTPLPECNVGVNSFSGADERKYTLDTSLTYDGDVNGDNTCKAVLAGKDEFRTDIYHGELTRGTDDEITVKIYFRPRGATGSTAYELEFRGWKKGWF